MDDLFGGIGLKEWGDDERSFQALFVRCLDEGSLCKAYEWAPCTKVVTESRVPGAVLDVVSYHEDGSISLFELKRSRLGLRDYMTGIGQLMHARVQYGLSFHHTGHAPKLRVVLAIPHAMDVHVGMACLEAGVEYLPFGPIEDYNAIERQEYLKILAGIEMQKRREVGHGA